jgi:hypothetical protein
MMPCHYVWQSTFNIATTCTTSNTYYVFMYMGGPLFILDPCHGCQKVPPRPCACSTATPTNCGHSRVVTKGMRPYFRLYEWSDHESSAITPVPDIIMTQPLVTMVVCTCK